MFNKKSVIGGLLLSASTLGVVGGTVATQNAMDAPVQKENVQKGTTENVTSNVESLKSKARFNEKKVVGDKQVASTTNSVSDTTVGTTSIASSESVVESNYVSEPTVKPINDFTYTVVNSAQSNSADASANEISALTYQAKPALVDVKAPVTTITTIEPDLDSIIVEHNRLVGANRTETSESENKVESEITEVAEASEDNVKSTDFLATDTKVVEDVADNGEKAVTVDTPTSNVVEGSVLESSNVSEPVVPEVQVPAVPENQVLSAEPAVNPAPVVENVESTVSSEPVVTEESAPTQERLQYSSTADSYPVGECTWGVKTVAPWVGDYWGNGGQWAESAAKDGFRTGKTAEVGSVVSWNDGGYGHVAYVTDVDPTTGYVKVLESNYNGNRTIQDHRGWFDASDPMWGEATYIYQN